MKSRMAENESSSSSWKALFLILIPLLLNLASGAGKDDYSKIGTSASPPPSISPGVSDAGRQSRHENESRHQNQLQHNEQQLNENHHSSTATSSKPSAHEKVNLEFRVKTDDSLDGATLRGTASFERFGPTTVRGGSGGGGDIRENGKDIPTIETLPDEVKNIVNKFISNLVRPNIDGNGSDDDDDKNRGGIANILDFFLNGKEAKKYDSDHMKKDEELKSSFSSPSQMKLSRTQTTSSENGNTNYVSAEQTSFDLDQIIELDNLVKNMRSSGTLTDLIEALDRNDLTNLDRVISRSVDDRSVGSDYSSTVDHQHQQQEKRNANHYSEKKNRHLNTAAASRNDKILKNQEDEDGELLLRMMENIDKVERSGDEGNNNRQKKKANNDSYVSQRRKDDIGKITKKSAGKSSSSITGTTSGSTTITSIDETIDLDLIEDPQIATNYNKNDGNNLNDSSIQVPKYFRTQNLSTERILQEVEYYRTHNYQWSERVILEIFYHSIYGVVDKNSDSNASSNTNGNNAGGDPVGRVKVKNENGEWVWSGNVVRKNLKNWSNDNVDICSWEGIKCGDITSGPGYSAYEADTFATKDEAKYHNERNGRRTSVLNGNCWCVKLEDLLVLEWDSDDEVSSHVNRRTMYNSNDNGDENEFEPSDDDNDNEMNVNLDQCICQPGYAPKRTAPKYAVTKIDLMDYALVGTLPPELNQLKYLHRLNLNGNNFVGSIPTTYGLFENLHFLDLSRNDLVGTLPSELGLLKLDELWLERNVFFGTIPKEIFKLNTEHISLSSNKFTGFIPTEIGKMSNLGWVFLADNRFTGVIPTEIGNLKNLRYFDVAQNQLNGNIPSEVGLCTNMEIFNLDENNLEGTFPPSLLEMKKLEVLNLSGNFLSGTIPSVSHKHEKELATRGSTWKQMTNLEYISLADNKLSGSIPPDMFVRSLSMLDLSMNGFVGSIPSTIKFSQNLFSFDIQHTSIGGMVPTAMNNLEHLVAFDFVGTRLEGELSQGICEGKEFDLKYPQAFPCNDYVACPPGYFHPDGAASDYGGCSKCPPCFNEGKLVTSEYKVCNYLARDHCFGDKYPYVTGDMDGDLKLSQREVLRIIFVKTDGIGWGDKYKSWGDISTDKCKLPGVNCKNGMVTKVDLRDAQLCSRSICNTIPHEIGLIGDSLEVLDLSRSFQSTSVIKIPTEIGLLTKLKVLDMSRNNLGGSIPSEIGNCKNLRVLNLAESNLSGSVPTNFGNLKQLEKMNIGQNFLNGTFPTEIGAMESLKELLVSRTFVEGSLPDEIGNLSTLENLELYSCSLTGKLPDSISSLTSLKRIDAFQNSLSGSLDAILKIPSIQIIHLKNNQFSGSIPNYVGSLKELYWFDVSGNNLVGTLPTSLSELRSLRDLRIGENMIESPVPPPLCESSWINGDHAKGKSCDFISCPLGTFSELGFATAETPCRVCPENQTTLYLGSRTCRELNQGDFLGMFFDAMGGDEWLPEFKDGWKVPGSSVCDWAGVTCDDTGQVIGLAFPLSGITDPDDIC